MKNNRKKPLISLIIICYNMAREIPRTICSLSPIMQRDVEPDDYEIILIDNGSNIPINVSSFQDWNVNLRYIELPKLSVSPVVAINKGLQIAEGEMCGVMIDGARMVSPRLIAGSIQAYKLHHRPIISTLGFHLGPEVQMKSVQKGYNQEIEDKLLKEINWQMNGYSLFEISTFAGSNSGGWFKPIAESNALFMPRSLWQELGGYEEKFISPGGGLANLDTYFRACMLPNTQVIILFGEGTFHQVHGGIATNSPESKWGVFHEEYQKIRGHAFNVPQVDPIYLGKVAPQILSSILHSVS